MVECKRMKAIAYNILLSLKAFLQLGWKVNLLYAWYQLTLRSGLLKIFTPTGKKQRAMGSRTNFNIKPLNLSLPTKQELKMSLGNNADELLKEADEILRRKVRLFGGEPIPLILATSKPLNHWTAYKSTWVDGQDIKFIWEPGRFGWATVLARAYRLSGNEKYAEAFWKYTNEFMQANPPNQGPHWISAQEVALRLIALTFSYHLFSSSSHTTPERAYMLAAALAAHASRIPPTLTYARAQNNNHLLTEAIGLYTAAALLPEHPSVPKWKRLGWKWFNWGIQNQIDADGGYIMHSTNYHRLMLQTALWAMLVMESQGDSLPEKTRTKLASATVWMMEMTDNGSGQVPNLGPNDGAYILPLTTCPFNDFRPVVNAAGATFLGQVGFPPGPWDEMALWFKVRNPSKSSAKKPHRLVGERSWANLQAAQFNSRPGHVDQLHLDLWWRGLNVAQDAGTYLYNAPPPWENILSGTDVHNTITINGHDQMTKARRFLWLDWAQAKFIEPPTPTLLVVEHDGYKKLGVIHKRLVEISSQDTWTITDTISPDWRYPIRKRQFAIRLHWLLPDWVWRLEGTTLGLKSPHGWVTIKIKGESELHPNIARAGELLHGEGPVKPHRGWASPTYGEKEPALSFSVSTYASPPVTLTSTWIFPS